MYNFLEGVYTVCVDNQVGSVLRYLLHLSFDEIPRMVDIEEKLGFISLFGFNLARNGLNSPFKVV